MFIVLLRVILILLLSSLYTHADVIQLTISKPDRLQELESEFAQYPFIIEDYQRTWDPKSQFALIKEYNIIVRRIQAGDIVIIGDKQFEIIAKLGGDSASLIFEIPGDRILRLGKTTSTYKVMRAYLDQYSEYKSNNVEIVNTYLKESDSYAIVSDKIHNLITMGSFLTQLSKKNVENYTNLERKMLHAIKDFEVSIAIYGEMDDVHLDQIGFDSKTKKWILFDWCNKPQKITSINRSLFLTDGYIKYYYPDIITASFYQEIKSAVLQKREAFLQAQMSSCLHSYLQSGYSL